MKDATISKFYKNNNLKDRDLPHEEVIIKISDLLERIEVKDLENGVNNENIILMDEF